MYSDKENSFNYMRCNDFKYVRHFNIVAILILRIVLHYRVDRKSTFEVYNLSPENAKNVLQDLSVTRRAGMHVY